MKSPIVSALILSSTNVWIKFHKYPLKRNMLCLAHAAKALAIGTLVAPDEQEQLNYASMLIDVSWNQYSALCKVQE
jgi:hypothetical protein